MASGTFITLEGPDGAGKSSQAAALAERIRKLGHEVIAAREPGGTALGEEIRRVLLARSDIAHEPLTDALLFNAARHQLVRQVIRPALARGTVVICDRFADSTIVYQGYGGGAPLPILKKLTEIVTDGLHPTRTVLVDLPSGVGLARRHAGDTAELTRFEAGGEHDLAFHERVRAGFLELARADPVRWRVVDGSRPPGDVATDVWAAVEDLFLSDRAAP